MAFLVPDNLKSRKDIPRRIQLVAKALEIALDSEATLWFEPLFDPSKQKPHYVLLLPDRGIVVLEVFESAATGILGMLRGRLRLTRDGKEIEVENPLKRAERFAGVLRDRIKKEPRLADVKVPVEAGAVLASLTEQEARAGKLDGEIELERCLFKAELDAALAGSGEDAVLRRLVAILKGTHRERFSAEVEKVIRGLIQPETVIDRVATEAKQVTIFRPPEGEDDIVRVMDRQQEAMAKSLGDGHRVIRGVAGSGKTLVLVYRAKLLAQNFPQHSFLVTCYNRSLAGELRALLADINNITVNNLDRLMFETILAARMKHPGYKDDPTGERVAEVALRALSRSGGKRYRAVLLDEAQDFGTNALRFGLSLLEPSQTDFIIVADSAQNIYKRKFSWKSAGIQAQGRTRILRVNYRNTKEVLKFASDFLLSGGDLETDVSPDPENENAVIPPEAARRSGPKPTLQVCGDSHEEVNSVVRRVRQWVANGAGPESYRGPVWNNQGRQRRQRSSSAGLSRDRSLLAKRPSNKDAKDHLASVKSPVVLSTIHSAKGLEFPRVALCAMWNPRAERAENRKLAYVGMTRASHELSVITTRANPLAGELKSALG